MSPSAGGYIVLQRVGDDLWQVRGEVKRRPGLPARRSRAQAVLDVVGRDAEAEEVFAVLPRSEWRVALDH
jgi:hypothetical protein